MHIENNGTTSYSNQIFSNTSSTASLALGVGGSSVGASFAQNNAYLINLGNSALVFGTNDTERMRITSNGNVGIGTTSPNGMLHVNGRIYSVTSGLLSDFNSGGLIAYGSGSTSKYIQIGYDTTGSYGWIQSLTTGVAYNKLVINGAGGTISMFNLGNGTGYALEFNNNAAQPRMDIVENGTYTAVVKSFNSAAWFANNSANPVILGTSGAERVRVTASGSVGIGTSSPSYTLHVNGSVAGTSAYVNLSDVRFKKNIKPLNDSLSKVLQLNGVFFDWNKDFDESMNLDELNHIGLLAQEVEKIIPQSVFTASDKNRTKSVAYTDLVPVLIEAIKELNAKIEAK